MSERVFIILDNSDEDSTEINIVDAPAWVADDEKAMHWLEGTPILVVKEYRALYGVNKAERYEDIICEKKRDYWKYVKSTYGKLSQSHIKRDRIRQQFLFTCAENQTWSFRHTINDYLLFVDGYFNLSKLLQKC